MRYNEHIERVLNYSDGDSYASEYKTMTGASMHLLHYLVYESRGYCDFPTAPLELKRWADDATYLTSVKFTIPDLGQVWEVTGKMTETISDLCDRNAAQLVSRIHRLYPGRELA